MLSCGTSPLPANLYCIIAQLKTYRLYNPQLFEHLVSISTPDSSGGLSFMMAPAVNTNMSFSACSLLSSCRPYFASLTRYPRRMAQLSSSSLVHSEVC